MISMRIGKSEFNWFWEKWIVIDNKLLILVVFFILVNVEKKNLLFKIFFWNLFKRELVCNGYELLSFFFIWLEVECVER